MLVCVVMSMIAIRGLVETRALVSISLRTDGTVIALNAGGSHPQISFMTGNGELISYPQGGLIFGFRPGDKVKVLFDPADPIGTATIDAFGAVWFVPLIATGLAIVFLILGVMSLRMINEE